MPPVPQVQPVQQEKREISAQLAALVVLARRGRLETQALQAAQEGLGALARRGRLGRLVLRGRMAKMA